MRECIPRPIRPAPRHFATAHFSVTLFVDIVTIEAMSSRTPTCVSRHADGWSSLLIPLPRRRYLDSDFGGPESALQAPAKDLSDAELKQRHRRQVELFARYEHDASESPLPGLRLLTDPLLGRIGWAARAGDGIRRFTDRQHGPLALNYAVRHLLEWRRKAYPLFKPLPEEFWFDVLAAWKPGTSSLDIRELRRGGSISAPDPGTLQARITCGGNLRSKAFSASRYGGLYFAAAAAVHWLNQQRADAPTVCVFDQRIRSSNTSGVRGVYRSVTKSRRGTPSVYWCASFKNVRGGRSTRSFLASPVETVTAEQEEQARALAVMFRTLYEQAERDGRVFVPPQFAGCKENDLSGSLIQAAPRPRPSLLHPQSAGSHKKRAGSTRPNIQVPT